MLTIRVSEEDFYDEETGVFVSPNAVSIEFEHSLVSVSKWESIWEKPFLDGSDKSGEQLLSYVECMLVDPNLPPETLRLLGTSDIKKINDYIGTKRTATWFSQDKKGSSSGEVVTSELIYYWMVALNIPFECETWHLSRLLTLVEVCHRKNSPAKKMTASEIAERNRTLNAKRRAELETPG